MRHMVWELAEPARRLECPFVSRLVQQMRLLVGLVIILWFAGLAETWYLGGQWLQVVYVAVCLGAVVLAYGWPRRFKDE